MKKNRLLITGSSGFVGNHLSQYLGDSDFELILLNRKELDLNNFDKTKKFIEKKNPDFVIHLASRSVPVILSNKEYTKQIHDTINTTINLTSSLSKKIKLFICIGSIEEYGNCPTPFNEQMLPQPTSSYGFAKVQSYFHFKVICKLNNIRHLWLRPSLMFGKGMKGERLMGSLINSYKFGKITEIKNPNAVRDFLYVKDFCKTILYLLENYRNYNNDLINITSENWYKIAELIDYLKDLFGANDKIKFSKVVQNTNNVDKLFSSAKYMKAKIPNFINTDFNKAILETFKSEGIAK